MVNNLAHFRAKKNDEYYTPKMLIDFLPPILKEFGVSQVLCPFDTAASNYVKVLSKDFTVVFSDDDFFSHWFKDEKFGLIVSNPPFSRKLDIFKFCLEHNYKFILLMNMMAINYQEIGNILSKFGKIGFIIPDKKVSFDGNTSSFCSGYITNLFNEVRFVNLPHNNSGKHYRTEN